MNVSNPVIARIVEAKVRPLGATPAVIHAAPKLAIAAIHHGERRIPAIHLAVAWAAMHTDQNASAKREVDDE
ncbi:MULTISPECIES: hypothetical protein [Alloalcanivorax]|jgi:hypothetical protein|uniref:hypothetical protein n=1 Tax=Alloalcanivorax TaxID=3020832 RepID=UPI0002FCA9AA|nr:MULTISPECIES: hypothetical protein [Alloalcanivorax]ARB45757.1 hypothetical protein P40_10325 [Alloalcanivorax xenomutans]ERS13035.1 hypothetical protein Q668_01785 [Alcanivorax sp. PN-3]GGJ84176.1 hypothetical protein GCM10007426_11600 [Alloalcanivorax dieselolei]CUR47393.1 hypothetical protein BN2364_2952 [Alloalcanivorax xenomutans]